MEIKNCCLKYFLGWSRGEHGEFSKFSNFDEATRVPLIIHVPGLSEAPIILDGLVELVDLFPTLVDLTQISEPLKTCSQDNPERNIICTEGRSLVPLMVAKASNSHEVSIKHVTS